MEKIIAVINGPNLNLLGTREPDIYGKTTLQDIENELKNKASKAGIKIEFFQSNEEGKIVDEIQRLVNNCSGLIINPGGYSHTSVAIRDAIAMVKFPVIEVHLSNIYRREEFRKHSYISGVATGIISGLGAEGYTLALDYLLKQPIA